MDALVMIFLFSFISVILKRYITVLVPGLTDPLSPYLHHHVSVVSDGTPTAIQITLLPVICRFSAFKLFIFGVSTPTVMMCPGLWPSLMSPPTTALSGLPLPPHCSHKKSNLCP